jgi:hypothetical protein
MPRWYNRTLVVGLKLGFYLADSVRTINSLRLAHRPDHNLTPDTVRTGT